MEGTYDEDTGSERQYAEKGDIEAPLLSEITSPMIPEEQYAAIVNSGL